jgi:transcriptional regulator with XRE-family HTH domain
MDLSQKLKQARLDAGLSQKALCGDRITRNMLSQIENGSARPSMDTLRYLATQLGKPLSYFLEDDAVTSPNQELMARLRTAPPSEALQLLGEYRGPDATFDAERWLLEALVCMELAETALEQEKSGYARSLLERSAVAGQRSPYYTPDLQRRRLLLCHRAGERPQALESQLPSVDGELLLRAEAALLAEDYDRCAALLTACQSQSLLRHYLSARMYCDRGAFAQARPHFEAAWEHAPVACCQGLEICCREMEDFAGAYFYACKLRELSK